MNEGLSYGELIWVYDMAIQDGEKEIAEITKKTIERLFPEVVKRRKEFVEKMKNERLYKTR